MDMIFRNEDDYNDEAEIFAELAEMDNEEKFIEFMMMMEMNAEDFC